MPAKRPSILALLTVVVAAVPSTAQLTPPTTGGIVELDRILQRLAQPRRMLMIGAHPDDEDTSLLSLMARGSGADVAYLSLSRGEGGQNLIGTELGQSLGILRSQELVSARSVDGARQFFARGFDFGYTRDIEETNRYWPADSILKDVVRIVRRFRPHVMVSIFSGTPRDGHGQHQAAGIAARRAFEVSGDSSVFAELRSEEGLTPWQPAKLYRSTRFDTTSATISLPTGGLDHRVGLSYYQIAMASRSLHRSQDMGRTQPIGPYSASLRLTEDRSGSDGDFFSGIDVVVSPVMRAADSLRSVLNPRDPSRIVPGLMDALRQATTDRDRYLLGRSIAIAAGLVIDGIAADDAAVPGETIDVEISLYNAGPLAITATAFDLAAPDAWLWHPRDGRDDVSLGPGELVTRTFGVSVPSDAVPTQPYFLEQPRQGYMYDWGSVAPDVRGLPFQPPVASAVVDVNIGGVGITLDREITYRTGDQVLGEIRVPLLVKPRVALSVEPAQVIWPAGSAETRSVSVTTVHHGNGTYRGEVAIRADGLDVTPPQRFAFDKSGEQASFVFDIRVPASMTRGTIQVQATALGDDGVRHTTGIRRVEYPHIRPVSWIEPAVASIVLAPIALPPVTRVGYIRGAADRVPEALGSVGLVVELLEKEQLATRDLGRFDVIVVGSRAYETDSALVAHNGRLLEFVQSGGLLVVQYQQYAFDRGGYAPYSLTINRPHDRITDETAPVRLLDPRHRAFHVPNAISDDDWDGWPQERGLYFPSEWDDEFIPLLEMNDPGREPVRGGLLVAPYGSGMYVYTGLSFFRALPAGVPGAFRLFFNILSLRPQDVP